MNVLINNTLTHDAFVIEVDGEVDVYTAPRLKEALTEGLDLRRRTLVVDLTRVDFLDSTALGVLVGAQRTAREDGGEVHLVVGSPYIAKMFKITGFDTLFVIHASVDEALGAA
ncbi:MAG: STAS domain-containing protein [Actinobacteria bacterium]|nr:STAS domain-containing protein [Actinomycetota bacterium]